MYFSGIVLDRILFKRSHMKKNNFFHPLLQLEIGGKKISEITIIRYYSNPSNKVSSEGLFYVLGNHPIAKGDSFCISGEGFFVNGASVIYSCYK